MIENQQAYFINKSRIKKSEEKIGEVLENYIRSPGIFESRGLMEISRQFKISHKTFIKYLKKNIVKDGQSKHIYFDDVELKFLKDLNSLKNKYRGFIDNNMIEMGKIYLNNFRI